MPGSRPLAPTPSSAPDVRKAESLQSLRQSAAAGYIGAIAVELRAVASGACLDFLALLLDMVAEEANQIERRDRAVARET